MYDIKPLESEWKKYKNNRQKPWYIAGIFFIILTLLTITFSGNIKIDIDMITSYFNSIEGNNLRPVKEIKSYVLLDNALVTLEIEKNLVTEVTKKDKYLVIETIEKNQQDAPNILVDIPLLEDLNEPVSNKLVKNRKKVHINIIETSSVTAYKDVERRFLQSHDVDDSFFLAKSYYKKGYYKEAEYWALETNKIDENIEESLFIFVKSKAKLGQKNEAEYILKNYISKTESQEAINLLFRIKNDTF